MKCCIPYSFVVKVYQRVDTLTITIFFLKFSWFLVLIYMRLKPKKLKLAKINPERQTCCQIREIRFSILHWFLNYIWGTRCLIWVVWDYPGGFISWRVNSKKVISAAEYSRKSLGLGSVQPISQGMILEFLKLPLSSQLLPWPCT